MYYPTKNIYFVLISKYGDDMWDNMNKTETAYIKKYKLM